MIEMKPHAVARRLAGGLLIAALIGLPAARAQFQLGLAFNPNHPLVFEPVAVEFKIENQTGERLVFRGTQANCRVSLALGDTHGGIILPVHDMTQPIGVLDPAAVMTATVSLDSAFAPLPMETYRVQLAVDWNGQHYLSEPEFLYVVSGVEMAAQTVVIPGAGSRAFSLRATPRDNHDHLLLQINDTAAGVCRAVVDIGSFVHTARPTLKIDAKGLVHIGYQSSPVQYQYLVFSPDGDFVRSQDVDTTRNATALETTPAGEVTLKVTPWLDPHAQPVMQPLPLGPKTHPKPKPKPKPTK
jgi:hypothetical protein